MDPQAQTPPDPAPPPQTAALPDAVAATLLSCVQTSLRLLEHRPTPANRLLAEHYTRVRVALQSGQPLAPADLRLLQRSLVSTQALAEVGGQVEGHWSSVTASALDAAGRRVHLQLRGAASGPLSA